jgi:hypothetical protein
MDTDEDRDTRGYAWTSQAGAALSNPSTSQLARDCEKPIAHLATQMALLRPEIFLKNTSLRLFSKRGDVVKSIRKPACECLFHNKSSIRVANQNRDFSVFLSVFIRTIRG